MTADFHVRDIQALGGYVDRAVQWVSDVRGAAAAAMQRLDLIRQNLNLLFQFFLFSQKFCIFCRYLLQKYLYFILLVAAHLFVKTSGGNCLRSQHTRYLPFAGFIVSRVFLCIFLNIFPDGQVNPSLLA